MISLIVTKYLLVVKNILLPQVYLLCQGCTVPTYIEKHIRNNITITFNFKFYYYSAVLRNTICSSQENKKSKKKNTKPLFYYT